MQFIQQFVCFQSQWFRYGEWQVFSLLYVMVFYTVYTIYGEPDAEVGGVDACKFEQ